MPMPMPMPKPSAIPTAQHHVRIFIFICTLVLHLHLLFAFVVKAALQVLQFATINTFKTAHAMNVTRSLLQTFRRKTLGFFCATAAPLDMHAYHAPLLQTEVYLQNMALRRLRCHPTNCRLGGRSMTFGRKGLLPSPWPVGVRTSAK